MPLDICFHTCSCLLLLLRIKYTFALIHVGEDNILPNVEAALARAKEIWRSREGAA